MAVGFQWSFFILALFVVVLAAYMFRYEPMPLPPHYLIGTTKVWDRWGQRPCMTSPETHNELRCDLNEAMIEEISLEGQDGRR